MTEPTSRADGPLVGARARELLLASLVIVGGLIGMLDVSFGNWRPGPGVGNHLVPMMAYWTLVLSGAVVLKNAIIQKAGEAEGDVLKLSPIPVLIGAVWAGLYFIAVQHIGTGVSSAVFLGAAIWLLSAQKERKALHISIIAIAAGAVFWVLFTLLAPIIVRNPLLF
jgi:hypothetical protein